MRNFNTAIIPIRGAITTEVVPILSFRPGATSTQIIKNIEMAYEEPKIKALIFEVNSPGGTPFAVKEVADKINNTKKPTVAWIREYGTSGAYWIASSCDKIVADRLSYVGSIGTVLFHFDFSEFMRKFGIYDESMIFGKYKGTGIPFRKLEPEERRFLKEQTGQIHEYFIEIIAKNRKLAKAQIEELSGASFLGQEAIDKGLVDYLGGKGKALEISRGLAKIPCSKIKEYTERRPSILDALRFRSRV
jgi:protease-4